MFIIFEEKSPLFCKVSHVPAGLQIYKRYLKLFFTVIIFLRWNDDKPTVAPLFSLKDLQAIRYHLHTAYYRIGEQTKFSHINHSIVPNKRGCGNKWEGWKIFWKLIIGEVGIEAGKGGGRLKNRKHILRNNFQTFFPYTYSFLIKLRSLFLSSKFSYHFDKPFQFVDEQKWTEWKFQMSQTLFSIHRGNERPSRCLRCRLSQQEIPSYQ